MAFSEEYAAQYWADMDRELEAWFDEDPVEELVQTNEVDLD